MATLTRHEPVLTYERSFEIGDEKEVSVYIPAANGKDRYAKVRPCNGTSCEEILWTINHFKQRVSGTGLDLEGPDTLRLFLETLGAVPREAYDDMVREINEEDDDSEEEEEEEEKGPERDPFEGSFLDAMDQFILHMQRIHKPKKV